MTRSPLNRRELLEKLAAGSLAATTWRPSASCAAPAPLVARGASVRIAEENQLAGTTDWLLDKTRIDPITRYRSPSIEGFCSHTSVRAGETIDLFVSANPPSPVTLDIFRLGYYGGAGGRLVQRLDRIDADTMADPDVAAKRLRTCQWPSAARVVIPPTWLSGVYVVKLTALAEGWQSYVIFIVRDDRPADLLFQCSDHTWQAYNRWPSQFSLYDDGKSEWFWGAGSQVSFNRPYGKYCQILDQPLSIGSGEFFLWEFPLAYWLESQGYDVSYVSNQDTHRDALGIRRAKGFLSVGHDEYWTIEMFHNVQQAIEAGVHVAFFSGNAVCGRIAYDPANRAFERVGVFGPPGGTREFTAMGSLPHQRPYANELVGAQSTGPVTGGADWICRLPDHWIYRDTGMRFGDRIPGLIGWEWHGDPAEIAGLEIVASGPTQSAPDQFNGGTYTATVYPGPSNNFVFNAATCWWSDGLSEPPGYVRPSVYTSPQGPHEQVRQMTHNILRRMLST